MRVFVTGTGVISPLGIGVSSNFNALLNKQSGLTDLEMIKTSRNQFIGGEIKLSESELKKIALFGSYENVQRTNLLAMIAAKEAWGDRVPSDTSKTAVIFGTTIGGINLTSRDYANRKLNQSLRFNVFHDHSFGTDLIARKLGISGYRATVSTACSTAANAILLGSRMIKAGLIDRALVGGAEAITEYTLNGFDSLQLYSNAKCTPFDENRSGLNLGEGSGFLVLENEESLNQSNGTKMAEVIGWGNACDAYHQTASSPDGLGAEVSLKEALKCAGIMPNEIDAINTHGTGTANNDLSESTFLKRCFHPVPPITSLKSYIGHTLAAAGGIEAVFCVESLQKGIIFPNINFKNPMKETGIVPVTDVINAPHLKTILLSSFGFGGNCTQIIFRK